VATEVESAAIDGQRAGSRKAPARPLADPNGARTRDQQGDVAAVREGPQAPSHRCARGSGTTGAGPSLERGAGHCALGRAVTGLILRPYPHNVYSGPLGWPAPQGMPTATTPWPAGAIGHLRSITVATRYGAKKG
jgi:hypothetical protein